MRVKLFEKNVINWTLRVHGAPWIYTYSMLSGKRLKNSSAGRSKSSPGERLNNFLEDFELNLQGSIFLVDAGLLGLGVFMVDDVLSGGRLIRLDCGSPKNLINFSGDIGSSSEASYL
jgi:hypothetical protein